MRPRDRAGDRRRVTDASRPAFRQDGFLVKKKEENMLKFVLALYILMANGYAVPAAVLVIAWCMAALEHIIAPAVQAIGNRHKGE